jgi:hypothetical protein
MKLFLLCSSLVAGVALFIALLLAVRARQLRATDPRAAVDYAWAVVPWVMAALCAAPAVRRIFERLG